MSASSKMMGFSNKGLNISGCPDIATMSFPFQQAARPLGSINVAVKPFSGCFLLVSLSVLVLENSIIIQGYCGHYHHQKIFRR